MMELENKLNRENHELVEDALALKKLFEVMGLGLYNAMTNRNKAKIYKINSLFSRRRKKNNFIVLREQ